MVGYQSSTKYSKSRLIFLPFLLFALFSILVARLFYLQVLRFGYYNSLANSNRLKVKPIPAPRGIIFDRHGKALVRNVASFVEEKEGKTKILGKDEALLRMAKGRTPEQKILREYLFKDAFAHMVGYIGQVSQEELLGRFSNYSISSFVGKAGLELEYEQVLRGQDGKELYEVDAKGRVVRKLGEKEAIPGRDIKTTLDARLQLVAFEAMRDVRQGAVVVSDPRDGGILALVSKPSFDPNIFTHNESYVPQGEYKSVSELLSDEDKQPFLNRAIAGRYPPGSTFKLITALAALESGKVTKDTKIVDTGVISAGGRTFGNWYFLFYGKTDGPLDIVGAIKRSNDIFFYKAADAAGVEKLVALARRFFIGRKLGIDLPGEEEGFVPSEDWKKKTLGEAWYLGDTFNLGIGQGYMLVTPLEVNAWTSALANGGILYQPHLILGKKKVLGENLAEKRYIDIVREGMRQSCDTGGVAWPLFGFRVKYDPSSSIKFDGRDFIEEASGSAKYARVSLGCKTGTAEVEQDKNPHAWITVFAPFYNPTVAVTVLVENGGEGSSVAGPIAKKILEAYFESL